MRTKAENSNWPEHGEDEYTATTFQLKHNPQHPKVQGWSRVEVGDHVISPIGSGVVTWLDEPTGNCLVRPEIAIIKDTIRMLAACIDLIDQYEAPKKAQCGRSSVTRNMAQGTMKVAEHYFKDSTT